MAEYRQLVSGLVRTLQRRKRSLIGRTRDWLAQTHAATRGPSFCFGHSAI